MGEVGGERGKVEGERWEVKKLFHAFDGKLGVDAEAEVVLDVVAEGRGGVGAVSARAGEAEENGLAVEAHEFEVAAVGLEQPAEFVELGQDEFLHGGIPCEKQTTGNNIKLPRERQTLSLRTRCAGAIGFC